jgi:hypothetical protein
MDLPSTSTYMKEKNGKQNAAQGGEERGRQAVVRHLRVNAVDANNSSSGHNLHVQLQHALHAIAHLAAAHQRAGALPSLAVVRSRRRVVAAGAAVGFEGKRQPSRGPVVQGMAAVRLAVGQKLPAGHSIPADIACEGQKLPAGQGVQDVKAAPLEE